MKDLLNDKKQVSVTENKVTANGISRELTELGQVSTKTLGGYNGNQYEGPRTTLLCWVA